MRQKHWIPCLLVLVLMAPQTLFAGEWAYAGHDRFGTSRSDGFGAISSQLTELPGVAWQVEVDRTSFRVGTLVDVDGDGVAEMIAPHRQRVAAFRIDTGEVVWTTPQIGVTSVWGSIDAFGVGAEEQILAFDQAIGGGVHLIDIATGAVLWSFDQLERSSGAWSYELAVVDVDGDGADEAVFEPVMHGTAEIYAVDWSTEDGIPRVATGLLAGADVSNNRLAAGDFLPDLPGYEIAVGQGYDMDVQRICAPEDAGASCDAVDGTFCICHVGLFESIWFTRAFPPPISLDSDGDGTDEVLTVYDHSTYDSSFGLWSIADGMAGGAPNSAALPRWFYDYAPAGNHTRPTTLNSPPSDINGDGTIDLLINLYDAGVDEVDRAGFPVDDGLNNPGGFAMGVYDAATGALQASLVDRYVLGVGDVDEDGNAELLVQVTTDWTFSGGAVEAWELVCAKTCSLELAWTTSDYRLLRFPESFDDIAFPRKKARLRSSDAGGGMYLWGDDELVLVELDGAGGVTAVASVTMDPEDSVASFDRPLDVLLIDRASTELALYDGALAPLASPYAPQSQAVTSWHAAILGPSEVGATPIVDGYVFWSTPEPTSVDDADVRIGDRLLLADDLDGDGMLELIGYSEPPQGGFELACRTFDGTASFPLLWTWSSDDGVDLVEFGLFSDLLVTAADLTGDGVGDIVIDVRNYGSTNMLVLDGATGALLMQQPIAGQEAYHAPPLALDLIGDAGYADTDGALDIMRAGRRRLDAYELGASTAEVEVWTAGHISRGAWTDLDGDGVPELIASTSQQFSFHFVTAYRLLPTIEEFWAPVEDLPPPADVGQAIALADLDDDGVLDVLWISSDGRLARLSGVDGALLDDFPGRLVDGELDEDPEAAVQPLSALITLDVDGDGLDEAIVGSRIGYLYAVNVAEAEGTPSLEWGAFIGQPVAGLAAGDVDADGVEELLVSTADGVARVLDGLGVAVTIESPAAEDCITGKTTTVSGTSLNIDSITVSVSGVIQDDEVVPAGDGTWEAEVEVPLVGGLVEILAEAFTDGSPVANASLVLLSDGDIDGDGVTLCGGDCDDEDPLRFPENPEVCDGVDNDCSGTPDADPAGEVDADADGTLSCEDCDDDDPEVQPGAEEVCEDGIDQDCDGEDPDCPSIGDDDDDDDSAGDDGAGGCDGCDGCAAAGRPQVPAVAWLALLAVAAWRRRR